MHRSSESIGAIATALAKAQTELSNPEKGLVGVIRSQQPNGSGDRSFRYASLASGLDVVRKSLGRHEIATVQTTSIDGEAGLIRLTTVLAHSSGEWLSSDWPVCPVSETASPHRMGAALTYARRYGLFTLVGIAGEDDLDAPDLPIASLDRPAPAVQSSAKPPEMNGHVMRAPSRAIARPGAKASSPVPKPVLPAEESAAISDGLKGELEGVGTGDALLAWAARILPMKNTLTRDDAQSLEKAFEDRQRALADTPIPIPQGTANGAEPPAPEAEPSAQRPLAKTRRRRDKQHLEYVASKPCLVCGRAPSDAHHLRFAEPRALGRKVSDEFTVPLCRAHHRHLHDRGDERAWWGEVKIDPQLVAQRLWSETR